MTVCAKDSSRIYNINLCITTAFNRWDPYPLTPGGNVVIHFNQLVVADTVIISKPGLLTLCEVDVLGTKVVLEPEGQFDGRFIKK